MMKSLIPGFLRRKVPLVLQYEMVECGAASLSMILQYFGKYLPLSDLRYQCGVSRDGSNMLNLKKAALHYGLSVKVGKQKPREILDGQVDFPCLAWWNYNHFVVFESADGYVYSQHLLRGDSPIDPEWEEIKKEFESSKEEN